MSEGMKLTCEENGTLMEALGVTILEKARTGDTISVEGIGRAVIEIMGQERVVDALSNGAGKHCIEVLQSLEKRDGNKRKNTRDHVECGVSDLWTPTRERVQRRSNQQRTREASL